MKLRSINIVAGCVLSTVALSVAQAADYEVSVTNITRGIHFTPLIGAAHDPSVRMFNLGEPSSIPLQAIAEGGDISAMNDLLAGVGATTGNTEGLLAPGQTAVFTLNNATNHSVFSLSAMLLPTNDGFVGVNSAALPMHAGQSVTLFARGYDAGTEGNDELVGSGAPGMPGFPAPPPVVASGTGTGGSGIHVEAEGYVHIHPGNIGDLDASGGVSDINTAVHRWQNPVARVVIKRLGQTDTSGPSTVTGLTGLVYSSSAVEVFWDPASSSDSLVTGYRVTRDGNLIDTRDGLSFFDDGLSSGQTVTYGIQAVDANGAAGPESTIALTTNVQ